jgi:hypothetical protein
MTEEYFPPEYGKSSFHCPNCGIKAKQHWGEAYYAIGAPPFNRVEGIEFCYCDHCRIPSIWKDQKMIDPLEGGVPLPNDDLPEEIQKDFLEARKIVDASPRGATALLRLVLQKLMIELGEKGKNINDDIASQVNQGLSPKVQEALDVIRIYGNDSVHPGQVDIKDDKDTAITLFKLTNFIAEEMLTKPKEVREIFDSLPESKKEQIQKRNNSSS